MGDIADAMLSGELCQTCGAYIDDDPQGVPRKCAPCKKAEKSKGKRRWTPDESAWVRHVEVLREIAATLDDSDTRL